jgi:hypothetical protein
MASAVEDAAVLVYGISRAYKESANCRLEAQYAYQREKEMVPLMMEEGYRADGWLGMLLGTRLWYGFCGTVLSSEGAFEGKVEELCRELGERGQVLIPASTSDVTLSDGSRIELGTLKLGALKKYALEEFGVDDVLVNDVDDTADPKASVISLILSSASAMVNTGAIDLRLPLGPGVESK